jgi:hypothetical protein
MAPQFRSSRARRAQGERFTLKAFAGAVLAVIGYCAHTTGAMGPAYGDVMLESAPAASLSRSGDDLILTGSIDHIFAGATFAGPNRAEKQDRARQAVDVMEMTRSFDGIRARLAELRAPKPTGTTIKTKAGAPIAVAMLTVPVSSLALDAIDDLSAPQSLVPMPKLQSEQLAYARAEVPATIFDGTITSVDGKKWSEKELWCMATAIYFESRGEAYRGQVAVGQVVMNRVKHKLYPDTICGVVFQNQHRRNSCQFSFACDGIPERVTDKKSWAQAQEIANGIVDGSLYIPEVGYATHYHATYVYPHWAPRMTKVTKIGLHVFYHFKRGWKFG